MKKNKKTILISALALVFTIALLIYLILQKTRVANNEISAIVTNVIDRPNQAEDGYYGITAKDSNGRSYSINATGYMNTPLPPESNGETCVDIPKVKNGEKVVFNLPKAEGQKDTFDICYKKNLSGYYFTVE